MPIPFILGALAIGGTVLGAAGHAVAKETNEEAQNIAKNAEKAYNTSKKSLELSQKSTENALKDFAYQKKEILETSVKQFLRAYERIKTIKWEDESLNFEMNNTQVIELKQMSSIYNSVFSGAAAGVAGAATGTIVALAASGSLPIVTGALSTAGSALMLGEIGLATSLAGSAFSLGAAFTPLSAIVAPVVFFSALSSSMKADENLEKAKAMRAEANLAIEKMKTYKAKSDAIYKRTKMFSEILEELNNVFSEYAEILDEITIDKMTPTKEKIDSRTFFTRDEIQLISVTRSLAGAMKSLLDSPILDKYGNIEQKSKDVYYKVKNEFLLEQ